MDKGVVTADKIRRNIDLAINMHIYGLNDVMLCNVLRCLNMHRSEEPK